MRLAELTRSPVFTVAYVVAFAATLAFIPIIITTCIALATAVTYRLITNRSQELPPRAAVLITGCSSGLGYLAALRLAQAEDSRRFTVFVVVRRVADARAFATFENVHVVVMDITSSEQIAAGVRSVEKLLHRERVPLVGVINNAGYSETGPLEIVSLEALRKQLEVNVVGQVAVTQAFLPLLREGAKQLQEQARPATARLVFVSSPAGTLSLPMLGPYCASKHALEAVCDTFRCELRQFGIETVCVQPGGTRTGFQKTMHEKEAQNAQGHRDQALVERYMTKFGQVTKPPEHSLAAPEPVADVMVRTLLDSNPFPRYYVGLDSQVAALIRAWVPEAAFDLLFKA